jgi:hypothetical protein
MKGFSLYSLVIDAHVVLGCFHTFLFSQRFSTLTLTLQSQKSRNPAVLVSGFSRTAWRTAAVQLTREWSSLPSSLQVTQQKSSTSWFFISAWSPGEARGPAVDLLRSQSQQVASITFKNGTFSSNLTMCLNYLTIMSAE